MHLSRQRCNWIPDSLRRSLITRYHGEEGIDGDTDSADEFVTQGSTAMEVEIEIEEVVSERWVMESEIHDRVPFGIVVSLHIDMGCELRVIARWRATGDGDNGVDFHLADEPDVF
ncbi:hypothetical protein LOK49_LG15G00257 [Camellia lanceoleosa]|uniref:Uncharacterized protein n=1 Tax=Camellia lanceoleosa TaxID=1840588 RepID=A0ACC0F2S4_9ERIC|nr:hypothetical protein LOK49_LG15G00257 [Camellia lanceoleosa]